MYSVVLALFVFLFTPRAVFAASHISRLQIPLHKSTVVIEKREGTSIKKILVSDYLTSTKAIISEKGTVVSAPSYYPYGSSISPLALTQTNKQYTGQQKVSDESSVYNYNARYYNPSNGIFIQPDSVEGPTRFTYVAGNPVMHNDPSGNAKCGNKTEMYDSISKDNVCQSMNKVESLYDNGYLDANSTASQGRRQENRNMFPNALSLIDQNYHDVYNKTASDGEVLNELTKIFVRNNAVFRARWKAGEINDLTYANKLSKDINEHLPYSLKISTAVNLEGQVRSDTPPDLVEKIERLSRILWEPHDSAPLAERLLCGETICGDFARFTSYVLAQEGIKSGIMVFDTPYYSHAVTLMNSGQEPYILDTTWGVEPKKLSEHRSQIGYKYRDTEIDFPWGSPFKINLDLNLLDRFTTSYDAYPNP